MRSFSKIPVGMWDAGNEALCALSVGALFLYMFLRTQDDITRAGTLRIRSRPWSRFGSGVTRDQVEAWIDELWQAGFVLPDWETEELLIRGYIQSDEVYKHANSLKAARSAILDHLESAVIKAELYVELQKLPSAEMVMWPDCQQIVSGLIRHLEPHGCPSRALPVPFAQGSRMAPEPLPSPSGDPPAPLEFTQPKALEPGKTSPSGASMSLVPTGTTEGVETRDQKQETEDLSSGPDGPDEDPGDQDDPEAPPEGDPNDRPDTRELCELLLSWLRRNGETRPGLKVTKTWLRDMRLLVDIDKREPGQVARCIEWCQRDAFWRDKVQCPAKLRSQYNTLRLQATRQRDQERAAQNGHHGRRPDPSANMPQPLPASAIAVPPPGVADDPAAYLEWRRSQQPVPAPAAPPSETEVFA